MGRMLLRESSLTPARVRDPEQRATRRQELPAGPSRAHGASPGLPARPVGTVGLRQTVICPVSALAGVSAVSLQKLLRRDQCVPGGQAGAGSHGPLPSTLP